MTVSSTSIWINSSKFNINFPCLLGLTLFPLGANFDRVLPILSGKNLFCGLSVKIKEDI